jgi:hypothetical protein
VGLVEIINVEIKKRARKQAVSRTVRDDPMANNHPRWPRGRERVFPATSAIMDRAIANTVAYETGHPLALGHVPGTDNYMWTPDLHPLHAKVNKTFQEKLLPQRDLRSVPETSIASRLVHIVNRIKEKRKAKPGVIEFE